MFESIEERELPKATTRRRRRWLTVLVISVAVIVVGAAAALGYVLTSAVRSVSEVERVPDALPTGSRPPEPSTGHARPSAPPRPVRRR